MVLWITFYQQGPDPDPSPWLEVKEHIRAEQKKKAYDPKKSCWVPDKSTGGFNEGLIESTEGEKVTVSAKGEVSGAVIQGYGGYFC